jgi:hypothetical protein
MCEMQSHQCHSTHTRPLCRVCLLVLSLLQFLRNLQVKAWGKCGVRADARAEPLEQEGAWREHEADEPEQRARPVDADTIEKLNDEEREGGRYCRSDRRVGGESGSRVPE